MEIWKSIEFDNRYQISTFGNIRRLTTTGQKLINGSIGNRGYKYIQLQREGKRINLLIHQLVAKAFIPNPENKPDIDHIDRNKLNNRVDNLRWCFHKENMQNVVHSNKYGLNGVRFNNQTKKWQVSKKNQHFYFDNLEESIQKRNELELIVSGEFAPEYKQEPIDNLPICVPRKRIRRGAATKEHNREFQKQLLKTNVETLRYYCSDCERAFDTNTHLERHYQSQSHLVNTLPINSYDT